MNKPIPLFVELCAGTAAMSLRLHKAKSRPPISRMGSKAGYADTILKVLGLEPGQGAERYLWCEPDNGVRLLLHAYQDKILAEQAAEVLRSWIPYDARELWERLKEEGPIRCPSSDPREVARFLYRTAVEYDSTLMRGGFVHPEKGGRYGASREMVAARAEKMPHLKEGRSAIEENAATVDPREVARWIRLITSNVLINLDSQTWKNTGVGGSTFGGDAFCRPVKGIAKMFDNVDQMPVSAIAPGAFDPSVTLPEGSIAYMDPPYVGTTPYAHDLPRSEVVRLARAWSDAGAIVCISEAEPIGELIKDGWYEREISWCRNGGGNRSFSKQQREFLTMNVPGRHPGRPRRPLLKTKKGKVL